MTRRRHLSQGAFFLILSMFLFAVFAVLMLANGWQAGVRADQARTIQVLTAELRGQRWEVDRARALKAELEELRFLAQAVEGYSTAFYRITRAAWTEGHRQGVSPYLILAVAHRESNFDPFARSYLDAVDKDGTTVKVPVAYGVMQINLDAWPDVDRGRIYDIAYNVQQGTRILRHDLDRRGGDVGAALFNYWGGDPERHGYGYPDRVLGSKYFDVTGVGLVAGAVVR